MYIQYENAIIYNLYIVDIVRTVYDAYYTCYSSNIQCTLYIIQCTLYNVQYTMYKCQSWGNFDIIKCKVLRAIRIQCVTYTRGSIVSVYTCIVYHVCSIYILFYLRDGSILCHRITMYRSSKYKKRKREGGSDFMGENDHVFDNLGLQSSRNGI